MSISTESRSSCKAVARALLVVIVGLLATGNSRSLSANDEAVLGELKVKVVGLRTNQGSVAFALFRSEENYLAMSNPLESAFVKVRERKCEWTVKSISTGEYALMLFHDRNDNGKLDTVFRLPTEPYGFSNNARALTRAPYFRESKFLVNGDTVIEVVVK